jgi:hypothetical protein
MATTNSKPRPLTFAISYGFLGGSLSGRLFCSKMTKAGFEQADPSKADIVIAHSAGCWDLKSTKNVKLLMLVGMPLIKPVASNSFRVNMARFRTILTSKYIFRGLQVALFNLYYVLRQPGRNLAIIHKAKQLQAEHKVPEAWQVIYVTNKSDPWTQSNEKLQGYMNTCKWSFISLTGSHDNIWEQPDKYVAIISHYARILEQANVR